MLATMRALAMVLSARVPAVLAVIAAFILALLATISPSSLSLYINIAFDLGVVVPSIGLYFVKG